VAEYGKPSSMYMPPSSTSSSGSSGSGKTHTVIVAPSQGVLRYVPFALNASVGDTVKFMWGANNHTVTKSSELALCNKTSDQPFASGEQNKSFVCKNMIHLPVSGQRLTDCPPLVTQVVNDTNPTFFYCGTPTHCEKGMFGIINPPNAYMSSTSVGMMMPSLAGQYPSTQAAMSYTSNVTANASSAASWGMNMNMSGMPSWSQQYMAENVLFTQALIALNPETMLPDGSVDFSNVSSTPLMVPTDVAASMSSNADSSYGSPASSSAASGASSASPSASAVGGSSKSSSNGAGALSSPRVAVALIAVAAAFFAL
jgi:plastocyanin